MTKGIKRTSVWKLYVRDEYAKGWTGWVGIGISKSKNKAKNAGEKVKNTSNRNTQYKVVKVTAKGYSSPYESL